MAMVDVDGSCHFGWLGLRVGGHLSDESAFIK